MSGAGAGETPYEHAAKLAVDAHPLPGEDLETRYVEDAEHWEHVYEELLEFKHALISEMDARLPRLSADATAEVERSDHLVLRAEAKRFEHRLGLWRRKLQQLRDSEREADAVPSDQARR